MKPTRRDYCQFLVSTQTNYTQTYFSDHHEHFSHDAINRYLQDDNVTPEIIWEQVKGVIETDPDAFLVFDDSVTDKNHSHKIEMVRLQYSGNAHGLIKGIGVVNCLYVNPKTQRYWIIDWRVFDPENDAKSKLAHMEEMFDHAQHQEVAFPGCTDGLLVCHQGPDAACTPGRQDLLLPAQEQPQGRRHRRQSTLQVGERLAVERSRRHRGKVDQSTWFSRSIEGQTISGCDNYQSHGMDCYERY